MAKNFKGFLYSKKIKQKDNKTFDKYYLVVNDRTFECTITEECKVNLIKTGFKSPFNIEMNEDNYFLKRKSYTRNDGTKGNKIICVLLGFTKCEQGEFTKITFDSVKEEEDSKKHDTTSDNANTTNYDLPF